MALLGNGFRQNLTGRITTATTALDGCMASAIPASYNCTAFRRNMLAGEGITSRLASVPAGKRHPMAWLMAPESGSMSSFMRGSVSLDGSATGELGKPATGTGTVTITGTAAAGLIVSATGTATISIDGVPAIVATILGTGQVTVSIDGSAALGAEASLTGTATMTIDGHSEIMGLGYMTGTTEEAGLTPAGIAAAVWNSPATQFNDAGTMGNLLNSAGAAADPLLGVVEGTLTLRDVQRIVLAVLAGEVTGAGTGTETFKGQSGEDRVVSTVDNDGNRSNVTLDAT